MAGYADYASTIDKVKTAIRTWDQIRNDGSIVNKGFGFNKDSQWTGFSMTLSLDCWRTVGGATSKFLDLNSDERAIFDSALSNIFNRDLQAVLTRAVGAVDNASGQVRRQAIAALEAQRDELNRKIDLLRQS